MPTLAEIESTVRSHRGSWQTLFRRHGAGWQCILYPRRILTDAEYREIIARLSTPDGGQALSAAEVRRNALRHRASIADEGGSRRGR